MSDHIHLVQSSEPVRGADTGPAVRSLDDVDIRWELRTRPSRPPEPEREQLALLSLARELADNPRNMLQRLVEVALDLCHADTAGVSLLEGNVFRWEAVAGVFASHRNGTMPREASPCGVCIDRNETQLMSLPDQIFPALRTEPRFVEALLIPFHDHGRPVGTVWIVAHSSARKFDREDERIVKVLARFAGAGWQLWNTADAAERANRQKDDFLAVLGHELRNPLSAMVMATQILQDAAPREPQVSRALGVVERQTEHMSKLIAELLDVASINRGRLRLERTRVDLRPVLSHAIVLSDARIFQRRHSLETALPTEPIYVDGDAGRLAQIVANLLDNAAKYTPDGGRIWLTVRHSDTDVCISVRDNGTGIPATHLATIFEPFVQLQPQMLRSTSGLGLGLALVQTLTKMHGGSIVATSDGIGKGSQFDVRLPLAPPPAAA